MLLPLPKFCFFVFACLKTFPDFLWHLEDVSGSFKIYFYGFIAQFIFSLYLWACFTSAFPTSPFSSLASQNNYLLNPFSCSVLVDPFELALLSCPFSNHFQHKKKRVLILERIEQMWRTVGVLLRRWRILEHVQCQWTMARLQGESVIHNVLQSLNSRKIERRKCSVHSIVSWLDVLDPQRRLSL